MLNKRGKNETNKMICPNMFYPLDRKKGYVN